MTSEFSIQAAVFISLLNNFYLFPRKKIINQKLQKVKLTNPKNEIITDKYIKNDRGINSFFSQLDVFISCEKHYTASLISKQLNEFWLMKSKKPKPHAHE
jgi:hypothetical protein